MSDTLYRNITGPSDARPYFQNLAYVLKSAQTKGELGVILSREVQKYSLYDLQFLGGKMNAQIERLPFPYRKAMVQLREHFFQRYHHLILLDRSGEFGRLTTPIRNPERFTAFCDMLPEGMVAASDPSTGSIYFEKLGFLFYYLLAAFAIFVIEEPGHPVGMLFPGGLKVEQRGSVYYCPVRDKEKEVFYALCNFCPALQAAEHRVS